MGKTSSRPNSGFKLAIAVLIALVAVVSAVTATRAAMLADDAGTMDSDGLDAVLNVAAVRALNAATLYQHYTAYTDYVRYKQMGSLLSKEFEDQVFGTGDAERDPRVRELSNRREEAFDLASTSQFFFVTRYLDQDGGYDRERELGEAWAESARWVDLGPDSHFAQADQVREKSRRLVGTLIVFAVALWFYTLASSIKHPLKYVLALAGLCSFLAGVVLVIRIEGWL
jgi:hypothetical protein